MTYYILGDGSGSNINCNSHWENLPGNENLDEPKYVILDYIHHFLPKAKIIIAFRDPVARYMYTFYQTSGQVKQTTNKGYFLLFPENRMLTFYAKCLLRRQFA